MRINTIATNLSFKKDLIATADVLRKGKNYECNIFELNNVKDFFYFEKVKQDPNWNKAEYLNEIAEDFPMNFPTEKTYTIENEEEQCLGFTTVEFFDKERMEISLLETCPKFAHQRGRREIKYIGQAIINFLINIAQERNIQKITVPISSNKSKKFYERCGFKTSNILKEDDATLLSKNYDKALAEYNRFNKEIKIIAKE